MLVFCLVSFLATGQTQPTMPPTGSVEFRNVRATMGLLGPARKDQDRFQPGDLILYSFDLVNLQSTQEGLCRYALGVEFLDSKGSILFPKEDMRLRESQALCPLGGNQVPTFAYADTDPDLKPGRYLFRVKVTDRLSGRTGTLEKAFEIVPRNFSLIRLSWMYSTSGDTAPPLGTPGQGFLLTFVVSQFAVDDKTGRSDVEVNIKVLDETGKPVVTKPFTGQISVPEDEARRFHLIRFPFQPNRAGQFVLEITATDRKAPGKPVTSAKVPFSVLEPR